jgi:hypothetical protein
MASSVRLCARSVKAKAQGTVELSAPPQRGTSPLPRRCLRNVSGLAGYARTRLFSARSSWASIGGRQARSGRAFARSGLRSSSGFSLGGHASDWYQGV